MHPLCNDPTFGQAPVASVDDSKTRRPAKALATKISPYLHLVELLISSHAHLVASPRSQHHNPSTWVSSDSAVSLLAWARPARFRAMSGTCHTDVGADVETGGALSPRVPDSAGQCRIVQDAARCDRQR